MKRCRGTVAYATAAILAVTALATVHLTARDRRVEATHLEFINVTARTTIPSIIVNIPTMTPTEENILLVQEVDSARNFGESARSIITTPKEDHLVLGQAEEERN